MPSALRSRVALFALMGAFLIPIGLSSLRGLTHVLTCSADVKTPFTITIAEGKPPEISSSVKIEPGEQGVCGGLVIRLGAGASGPRLVRLVVTITNGTEFPWRGTVEIALEGETSFPLDIGRVAPHRTASDEVELKLPAGPHQVGGSLLIGP